ncbi:metallophosphoesterase [Thermococcus sp. SY098]|uniref:metallophosphoesterase n=1 Tax=Thermococcus sp. SY098 TaxID=3111325 RepID=UPI002D784A1F|nr:metallophosphoesterase [Thermococcus sp. SY098]WRS52327.1 metallophosphoesterase [Thermococcus sp. SY098]
MRLNLPNFLRRQKIPDILLRRDEKKIMHISDTPDNIYVFLLNLIEKTKPDYIIHTGDLVDNIKLERRPELRERYEKSLIELLHILENSKAEVYIVPGNEDDVSILRKRTARSKIVPPGTIIEIEGVKLAVGHRYSDVAEINNVDFRLYGHNFRLIPKGINGVLRINFILLPSKRVVGIKYPDGTNFERGYRLMRGM